MDITSPATGSALSRFRDKSRDEKLRLVAESAGLGEEDLAVLAGGDGGITFERADGMVENAIGTFALPLGVATNFRINGRDVLIPMVIEESSVIAAASNGAKTARAAGGFHASASEQYSIGQIQLLDVADAAAASKKIDAVASELLDIANSKSSTLPKQGRGAKQLTCKTVDAPSGSMLVVELLVDVGDAMGANVTNTMCESVAPRLAELSGGRVLLRILSNYSEQRMAIARAIFPRDAVGGPQVVQDIVAAYEFADNDVYRAVTHNKGVMNGVIAVANALGQDSRAIEAAANAYASKTGRYRPLTSWSVDDRGNLAGVLEMPLAVGIVGGIVKVHPVSRVCMRILGATTAGGLACIMASAGLAQNYAALRALVTDGIQKGHMRLHAKNLALAAGAKLDEIDDIVRDMISQGKVSVQGAKTMLDAKNRRAE